MPTTATDRDAYMNDLRKRVFAIERELAHAEFGYAARLIVEKFGTTADRLLIAKDVADDGHTTIVPLVLFDNEGRLLWFNDRDYEYDSRYFPGAAALQDGRYRAIKPTDHKLLNAFTVHLIDGYDAAGGCSGPLDTHYDDHLSSDVNLLALNIPEALAPWQPAAEQTRGLAYADEEDSAEAEQACRLTGTDVSQRIALELIWQLSAESGEVRYERLSLDESETAELAALVAALPSDEVRRVVTRLRLAKDRAKGYTWRGDHIPFRPLPEAGDPVSGTPVHVWQHGDVRHEITAVSVVGRTLYEIAGTNGYERMRPRFGAQIIARSSVAGQDPAYRVFWQLTAGGWHSATDDLPTAEFVSWNGCRTLDAIRTPTAAVSAWLDRVLAAVTDDTAWEAAAPAGPAVEAPAWRMPAEGS